MPTILKPYILPASVFITGACVLVIEIVATRILSPFYGNTIFTVSSVISVILASLSLGYYLGGRLADKHPSWTWFFGIILSSSLVLLFFHFIGQLTLPLMGYALSISTGPLLTSLLLFFLPALLLGTLSPYAVKLQSINFPTEGLGTVAGKIFFWSTLGSITGSLAAGFVLIPYLGVNRIIIGVGLVLFCLGLLPLIVVGKKRYLVQSSIALMILLGLSAYATQTLKEDVWYEADGIYEKITIFDSQYRDRPTRFFKQDRSSSGAMFLDSDDPRDLTYDYSRYYELYKIFKPEVRRALVIGGGAYSLPKVFLADLPQAMVEVSEIEPSLYELAKKYFGVKDHLRLRNHIVDGRRLLHDSKQKYDLIFSDVYYSLYSVPAHFTTQEFFALAKSRLSQDGIFLANMIGDLSPQAPSLTLSEIKTFRTIFPNSYFFAVNSPSQSESQNIIFVGYNSDQSIDWGSELITANQSPFIRSLPDQLIAVDQLDLTAHFVLTDDYAPTEYLTGQVLKRNLN